MTLSFTAHPSAAPPARWPSPPTRSILRCRITSLQEPDGRLSAGAGRTVDGIADMDSWAAWFIDPGRNVLSVVQPKA
jgi:hypothetical protein